jgi:hypothetical protein
MKSILIILIGISILLMLSTLICGLWIRNNAEQVETSSIDFHMTIGIASVVLSAATMVLAIFKV